ncbi:DUF3556 domain-containing protein [Streptomyces sp. NPDC057636]|uniref:DUF3556 domain-containing protein n=1 Tax=Streptomyces sp. NPDC057636 TaxID=3346189 RepID=UPI0036CA3564
MRNVRGVSWQGSSARLGLRPLARRGRHEVAYGREVSGRRAAGRPVHRQTWIHEVHDAALGLLERCHVKVHEMMTWQPWPADGPDHLVHVARSLHPLRPVSDADGSVEGLPPMDMVS